MKIINYNVNNIKRRLIFEGGNLSSAVYFEKESLSKGMIFLGRVDGFHAKMKGYFVDLGSGNKGLYQTSESLDTGKHYLFEVHSTRPDKSALLSRKIGFVGKFIIYQPGKKTRVSRKIKINIKEKLLDLSLKSVYFRSESSFASKYEIIHEYKKLKSIYEDMLNIESTQKKAQLIYKPPKSKKNIDISFIENFEEEIVRLSNKSVFEDGINYYIEPTKVGIVIDVNRGTSKLSDKMINQKTIDFISRFCIIMNLGGILLVDLIGNGRDISIDKLKQDERITHFEVSKSGILEILRRRIGVSVFDKNHLEIMAEFIKTKKNYWKGPDIKGITISKRYKGIEDYIDLPIYYAELFDYFSFKI